MFRRSQDLFVVLLAAALTSAAHAQSDRPVAYITVLTGDGTTRDDGTPVPTGDTAFSDESHGLRPGDGVRTTDSDSAVVALPDFGTVVHLGPASELRIDRALQLENALPAALTLLKGQAQVVQRPSEARWMLLAAAHEERRAYTLSKGASLVVRVEADEIRFTVTVGEAQFFSGAIPDGAVLDASGRPAGGWGVPIPEGHTLSTKNPAQTLPEADAARSAGERLSSDCFRFALRKSAQWVERAEQGDFTPVRGPARGAAQFFAAGLTAEFAFDQPRSQVVAPAPRAPATAITTPQVNQARALIESGIPTSVVVGQRLRRSRIIGNPGTTGGQIRFNPSAEQLIRLPGGDR